LRPERGPADLDRRHRFNLIGILALPNAFQTGLVLSVLSGSPFNITTGFDDNGDTVANDRPAGVTRNTGRGPRTVQLDLRFAKTFNIAPLRGGNKRDSFDLIVDVFNATNHTNVSNTVGVLSSPSLAVQFGGGSENSPVRCEIPVSTVMVAQDEQGMHRVSSNTWRLWREMRPYAWHLVALFVFSLLATPLALLTPLPLKIAVDNINARPLPSFLVRALPRASHARTVTCSPWPRESWSRGVIESASWIRHLLADRLYRGTDAAGLSRQTVSPRAAPVVVYHDGKGTADSLTAFNTMPRRSKTSSSTGSCRFSRRGSR